MAGPRIDIDVDEKEFAEALESFDKMYKAIDAKFLKSRQAYYAKPMVNAMKAGSPSDRVKTVIGITRAKKRAGKYGIKVGVVKNNPSLFPDFSSFGLASVLEYGTAERYRTIKSNALFDTKVSTGAMPAAPYLRPAWDANVRSLMNNVENAVIRKVQKEK